MASPLVLFLCFVSIYSVAIADLSSEFAHHAVLDPAEKMKLYWTVDWDAKMVYFAVEAATTGWVGFGFSGRSGAMIGSDVVIGWVKNNEGYLRDRFADEEKLPPVDEQQDYKLIGFEESGGKTVLKFKREFDTCDSRDRKLEAGATKVVFAYHDDDPASESKIKYHTFRGSRTLMLLNSMDKRNINETGWLSFPITTKNVTIPAKETTYWCALIKAPELQSKHHITKVEPLVQKGNEGFVHHLILYECEGNFTENDYDQGRDCMDTANMPYARCRDASIVVAWAVGGESFYYPLHAGFPLGADDSPKNFLLEMHYDNPSNVPGRVDSSGVRIYYTDKLRKYDSGIVSVGVRVNNWHIIPPKQKDWLSIGYCTAECTESIFNSTSLQGGGINVFASILHTHLAGRAIWTRHIRNGKELPEIARDDQYDFNFQDTQVLRKEINIQPGDEMIHYCKYNSMDRDQLTKGGIASREEMCLDFLFYYPRVPKIKLCQSTAYGPPYKFIKKYLKDASLTSPYRNPMTKTSLDWTDEMVADFREYNEEVQRVFPRCGIRKFSSVADTMDPNFTVPIPKIAEPLPTEKSDCPQSQLLQASACHLGFSQCTLGYCVLSFVL
ncbi:LOW QUALITY PROTEIN: DBH-like monooxygenase protein 1 [Pocillopora verrucosa]|uniref:LOW QUALITY PROTEIN: DBH-like monooxygenase protein 1 n=1 Tax=Pocillopora verrucosa TaxID=203993 RepID=UPI00333E8F2D